MMPICVDCGVNFPLLKEDEACKKCRMLEGKGLVEKMGIKDKGQCKACSLVYTNLEKPLCAACCCLFADGEFIPQSILDLDGAPAQLTGHQKSDFASEILDVAAKFQRKASDNRLGLPRTQNTSLQKAATSHFKKPAPGISKGKTLLAEMKVAKDVTGKIRIAVCLYVIKSKGGTETMRRIPQVQFSMKFDESVPIYDALGTILSDAQEFHRKISPLARPITRQIASFYAHESATRYYHLPNRFLNNGTVGDLLEQFVEQGYISKVAANAKQLEIRIVCEEDCLMPLASGINVMSSSTPLRSSKHKLSNAATNPRESGVRNIRKSAWPPSSKALFARSSAMTPCTFTRSDAHIEGPTVIFTHSETISTIFVADDWKEGWEKSRRKEDYSQSGYIGRGASKRVIYARFDGQEYALGQLYEDQLATENRRMLRAEYENLVQGESFRKGFEDLGLEYSVLMPEFRFNLAHAILGCFTDESTDFTSIAEPPSGLPFFDFIATRLLPCGPVDAPIEKFTGNDDVGPAPGPKETMTITLHAFTHYVGVLSRGNLILCDLQGMRDKNGVMCLIDPQSHSSEEDSTKRIYWDRGPNAIKHFMTHHLKACRDNAICNALSLMTIEFDDSDDDKEEPHVRGASRPPLKLRSSRRAPSGAVRVGWPEM